MAGVIPVQSQRDPRTRRSSGYDVDDAENEEGRARRARVHQGVLIESAALVLRDRIDSRMVAWTLDRRGRAAPRRLDGREGAIPKDEREEGDA